jgi:hypothetical protein
VEKITMKKPKTVANMLTVVDVCIEASEAQAQLLETRGTGTSRKKEDREINTADRAIARTEGTVDTMASNHQSRMRRGIFDVLMMQRSGLTFTAPWGMIWKSAKLFWIGRRCHHQ